MDPNLNPLEQDSFDKDEEEEDDVPDLDEDDLYSILNVPRESTTDDITKAYRRLSKIYHPDKHTLENKTKAEQLFNKIKKAYEILVHPSRRAVYNEVGMKGLETEGNELILRQQTPREIQEEYERLNREREERELERMTNPKGSIVVKLNATEMFNPYSRDVNDDYYSESGPMVEFSGFHFNQSVETPLTLRDTFVMSGSVNAQNGRGRGNIACGLRKTLTDKSWGEITAGGSTSGLDFGLKGFSSLGRRYYFNFDAACGTGDESKPSLILTVGTQLSQKSNGSLVWRMGSLSGVQTVYVKEVDKTRLTLCLHLGIPHSYASVQVSHEKESNKFRVGARGGTFGALLEYGIEKRLSPVSVVGATVTVGVPLGISVRFKVVRSSQTYLFPIQLAEEIIPSALFYGTTLPILVWILTKKLFIEPLEKGKVSREKEKKKMSNRSRMNAKRLEADNAKLLMAETFKRITAEEEKKRGLLIVHGVYGKIITSDTEPGEVACTDVKIPLQCMVKDSKLIINAGGMSSLPGFYDPAIGEEKCLLIKYQFLGELHEVVIRDKEALKIPKQAHRVAPL